MTIDDLFGRHGAVALDSDVLIYTLEGAEPFGVLGRTIIDGIESGQVDATIASIALTEVLAGPAIAHDDVLFEVLDEALWSIAGLTVVPMDRRIAVTAARLRGNGHGIADAIHLATALLAEATCFITNDRRIRDQPGIEVIYLSDITAEPIEDV